MPHNSWMLIYLFCIILIKHCPEAALISKKVLDIEHSDPNKRSSSSSDSTSKPPMTKKNSSNSMSTTSAPTTPTVKYELH